MDIIIEKLEENTGFLVNIGLLNRYTASYKYSGSEKTFRKSFNFNIAEALFDKNKGDKNLVVSEAVTEIPQDCFRGSKVDKLALPAKLQKIGKRAFQDFVSKKLVIPSGVAEIPEFCFVSAEIDELVLPAELQKIGEFAFQFLVTKKLVIVTGVAEIPKNFGFLLLELDKLLILNPEIKLGNNDYRNFRAKMYMFGDDFQRFTDAGIYKDKIINLAKVEDASLFMELCGDIPIETLKPIHEKYNIKCWKKVLPTMEVEFNKQRQQIDEVGFKILGYWGWTLNQLMHINELKVHDTLNLFFTKETNEGAVHSKEVTDDQNHQVHMSSICQ